VQLVWVAAQPPWHWLAAAGTPVEDMHVRWDVCTPWPHVTEHGELLARATQVYVTKTPEHGETGHAWIASPQLPHAEFGAIWPRDDKQATERVWIPGLEPHVSEHMPHCPTWQPYWTVNCCWTGTGVAGVVWVGAEVTWLLVNVPEPARRKMAES
jgi:hypothetical protein